MFTGIIQAIGTLVEINEQEKGCSLTIQAPDNFLNDSNIGDSICVQGVCLTATSIKANTFRVDASSETLQCTTLNELGVNAKVNLELALTLSTRLGGHLVTGHVDGVGYVQAIKPEGEATNYIFVAPKDIAGYIARKGSICIDGVSLTVNHVDQETFKVTIIPHTFENTVINQYKENTHVNLEVDLLARYIERLQEYTK